MGSDLWRLSRKRRSVARDLSELNKCIACVSASAHLTSVLGYGHTYLILKGDPSTIVSIKRRVRRSNKKVLVFTEIFSVQQLIKSSEEDTKIDTS